VNEDQFEEAVKIIKEYEDKMLGDDEESSQWIVPLQFNPNQF